MTDATVSAGRAKVTSVVPARWKPSGPEPAFLYRPYNAFTALPSTFAAPIQWNSSGLVPVTSVVGFCGVPPFRVCTSWPPCCTTTELRMNGAVFGRLKSALTVPRNVSEKNHAVRPSGSATETVLSPPVQWPPWFP